MRTLALCAGIASGAVLFAALFTVWMVFGADPNQDPLLSF